MRDELQLLDGHKNYPEDWFDSDAIPAMMIVDSKGQITSVNQSARTLYEKPGETLDGKHINEVVITPEILEFSTENIKQIGEERVWTGHFLLEEADGKKTWTTISIVELRRGRQRLSCLICQPHGMFGFEEVEKINRSIVEIDGLFGLFAGDDDVFPKLARLFIPEMADWCCIHLFQSDGAIDRVAVEPADVLRNQQVYDWLQNDLPNDEKDGLPAVFQNGKMILVHEVNPVRRAADAGIRSYMIVPMRYRQKIRGTITFTAGKMHKPYDQASASLAENLAMHIAANLGEVTLLGEEANDEAVEGQKRGECTGELQQALAQLKQSEEVIQSLFRLSNKLNATLDVDIILDTLAQEAIQMVGGESGFAGLRTAEGMSVHKYYQNGEEIPFEHTWAPGEGIPGWVLKYKVPYGASDAAEDPMLQRELAINENVRSVICTPILDTVGEVIAYFNIRNKKGAEGFSISDQELLLTLAPVASIAIQNAKTYQQRQESLSELEETARQLKELAASLEAAREEERLQVAQELHDELGQALAAIKFDLAWLTEQLGKRDETLSQKTIDISSQVNSLINTVRKIAAQLRPGMLDDLGLAASIEWQAHDFEKHSGIKCNLSLSEINPNFGRDKAIAIFRIFQEALTNIMHYADAKTVTVILKQLNEWLILEVHDDGRGIKEEDINAVHALGLIGMRERAEHLGGSLKIRGESGLGTTLTVTIPLENKQDNDGREVEDNENLNR